MYHIFWLSSSYHCPSFPAKSIVSRLTVQGTLLLQFPLEIAKPASLSLCTLRQDGHIFQLSFHVLHHTRVSPRHCQLDHNNGSLFLRPYYNVWSECSGDNVWENQFSVQIGSHLPIICQAKDGFSFRALLGWGMSFSDKTDRVARLLWALSCSFLF